MKVSIAPDFRDLFRPLTDEEFEQAKANNQSDPEHERIPPVVVWQCGKEWIIVDGHHTHRIRENLRVNGKPVKVKYHKLDFADRQSAMAYAIHAQIGRRNLDASQLAMALAKLPKAKPGRSGNGGQLAGNSETRESLATEAGIGIKTLQRADKVTEHGAKAVQDAVTSGEVSVSDAASVVDLPKKEQLAALKKVVNGEANTLKAAAKPKESKTKRAAKGKEVVSSAKLVDMLTKKHVGHIARGLTEIAEANGGEGEQFNKADAGLNQLIRALQEMRKGKR